MEKRRLVEEVFEKRSLILVKHCVKVHVTSKYLVGERLIVKDAPLVLGQLREPFLKNFARLS